jgi:hypothetical protein
VKELELSVSRAIVTVHSLQFGHPPSRSFSFPTPLQLTLGHVRNDNFVFTLPPIHSSPGLRLSLTDMPALHSAGIHVRLATVPLKQTLTPNVVLKKGEIAAQQCEKAEAELRKSKFLDEECVAFPGDEEGFSMNWLGGAPFLMVRTAEDTKREEIGVRGVNGRGSLAGGRAYDEPAEPATPVEQPLRTPARSRRDISSASTNSIDIGPDSLDGRRLSRPATRAHPNTAWTVDPVRLHLTPSLDQAAAKIDADPKALVLHVILTDKTFYESIESGTLQHIKIDVFLNGQLSSCVLLHHNDLRAGTKSLHQIFAGNRVDYMIERPWVIHSPRKSLCNNQAILSVQNRWEEISRALMTEANARGVKAGGERPPSGKYLNELANMQMPATVSEMQKPGGRTFGVVDVVVTVGKGKKVTSGVGYLKTPMRLVDDNYPFQGGGEAENNKEDREVLDVEQKLAGGNGGRDQQVGVIQVDGQDEHMAAVDVGGETQLRPSASALPPDARPLPLFVSPPVFRNPFTGISIPNLTPPGPDIYSAYPATSSASSATPRGKGTPPSRKRLHSQLTASEDGDQTHSEDGHFSAALPSFPSAHAPMSAPRDVKPPTKPSRDLGFHQYDGFAHAYPYQLPYADMMMGMEEGGLPGLSSFDGSVSSPLRDPASGHLVLPTVPSFNQQELNQGQRLDPTSTHLASSPFSMPVILPGEARRVSFGQANVASFDPRAPPTETPATLSMPVPRTQSFTGNSYSSSPLAQHSSGPEGPKSYFHMSSFMRHSTGPDPPIGYFRPTPALKRAHLLDPGLIDVSQPRPSILVRQLRITGIDGATIVDYKWHTPQRIAVSREQIRLQTSSKSSSKPRRVSPGSSDYVESRGRSCCKRGSTTTMGTPPSTSPTKATVTSKVAIHMEKPKRESVHDKQIAHMPSEPWATLDVPAHQGAAEDFTITLRSDLKNSSSHSTGTSTTTDQLKIAHTRRTPSNGILGVQGPKASIFVFDNPEELLRHKGLKSRSDSRSTSSTNVDAPPIRRVARACKGVQNREVKEMVKHGPSDPSESSSLSSLPTSPETRPTEEKEDMGEVLPLPQVLTSRTSAPSSSLPSAAPPPPPPTLPPTILESPAPRKQLSTSVEATTSFRKLTAASKPSPSIALKKRNGKRTTARQLGPADREPRNFERVNTAENPPLNQNCVIQFAQSGVGLHGAKGKDRERLLRQVKSERQGVFSEESVVVGVRFFVGA